MNKKSVVLELALGLSFGFYLNGCGDSPTSSENPMPASSQDAILDPSFGEPQPLSSETILPPASSESLPFPASSSDLLPASSAEVVPTSSSLWQPPSSSSFIYVDPESSNGALPPASSAEVLPPTSSQPWVNPNPSLIGADISAFQEYEASGVKIYDVNGKESNVFEILREAGFNAIRLKTFVSPKTKYGYSNSINAVSAGNCGEQADAFGDKEHVLAYAKKVKAEGFYFLLDIHYSDNWADPGKQIIPERWRSVWSSDAMADSVYAYTYDLVSSLKAIGATPDMVQVGNEITNGLLRDLPTASTDCWGNNIKTADASVSGIMSTAAGKANTAKYLKAGVKAVKAVSQNIKTSFHIENIEKVNTVNWWMTEIFKTQGVQADAMGFSAYTAYDDGRPNDWKSLFTSLAGTYSNLEFFIAEYNGGAAADQYGFDGSRLATHEMMTQVPRGMGAFFWEPAKSGAWGAGLFDWKNGGLYANKKAFEEYAPLKKMAR